jgi:threonyl-tRNA synthetase
MELARSRDHRVIGKAQGLFMFHDMSPGSAFMLPHGTRIYNTLLDTMRAGSPLDVSSVSLFRFDSVPPPKLRAEYRKRGYQEVMTPLMYRQQLWKTSGHWENYKVARDPCSFAVVVVWTVAGFVCVRRRTCF